MCANSTKWPLKVIRNVKCGYLIFKTGFPLISFFESHNHSHISSRLLIMTSTTQPDLYFSLYIYSFLSDLIVIFSSPFQLTHSPKACNLFKTLQLESKLFQGNLKISHQSSSPDNGCPYKTISKYITLTYKTLLGIALLFSSH